VREFSFALHQVQQAIEPGPLLSANALFVESDRTGSSGKVTQPATSIGEMASLVIIAPRPTDGNLLPVRSRLRCRVVGPSSPITQSCGQSSHNRSPVFYAKFMREQGLEKGPGLV